MEYNWQSVNALYAKLEKPAGSVVNMILIFAQSVVLKIEMKSSALAAHILKQQKIIVQVR